MSVTIYHNPRCSKSRATLALLEERGLRPTVVEYLTDPPDAKTLGSILKQLGRNASELMRTGEDEYKQAKQHLTTLDETALLDWLCAHPRVLERPIVVTPKGARIGRPPENVLEIL